AANKYFDQIERIGGVVAGIEKGWFQMQIAESSYRYVKEVERKERIVVGVNEYTGGDDAPTEILKVSEASERRQLDRLAKVKRERSQKQVDDALHALQVACEKPDGNLMPFLISAAHAYATLGEIREAMVK